MRFGKDRSDCLSILRTFVDDRVCRLLPVSQKAVHLIIRPLSWKTYQGSWMSDLSYAEPSVPL